MTNAEAIEHLKEWREVISSGHRKAVINMAIEALSAEPPLDIFAKEYKAYRESISAPTDGGLISRESVIEALTEFYGYSIRMVDEITDLVNSLPSAEPSGDLISRAKAKEALYETVERNEWIPCSERLPDAEYGEGDSVLCCTESGLMYILYWDGGNWCVPTGEPHEWVNHITGWHDKVIAWRPLPKPYREDDEDYELATEQMEHDAMYEPTYNPEDGSM